MINKRIHVNTVMGPASTTGDKLIAKCDYNCGRNYDCEIENEFEFDYRRECVRVFRYEKLEE